MDDWKDGGEYVDAKCHFDEMMFWLGEYLLIISRLYCKYIILTIKFLIYPIK